MVTCFLHTMHGSACGDDLFVVAISRSCVRRSCSPRHATRRWWGWGHPSKSFLCESVRLPQEWFNHSFFPPRTTSRNHKPWCLACAYRFFVTRSSSPFHCLKNLKNHMFIKIGSDVSHATHVQDKYLCLACTHVEEGGVNDPTLSF